MKSEHVDELIKALWPVVVKLDLDGARGLLPMPKADRLLSDFEAYLNRYTVRSHVPPDTNSLAIWGERGDSVAVHFHCDGAWAEGWRVICHLDEYIMLTKDVFQRRIAITLDISGSAVQGRIIRGSGSEMSKVVGHGPNNLKLNISALLGAIPEQLLTSEHRRTARLALLFWSFNNQGICANTPTESEERRDWQEIEAGNCD
jgi:hypothetical protein